jgi:hypothetical protein
MNDETTPSTDDHEAVPRLEVLIDRYLQGDLDEADRAELSRALLASPTARTIFWEMARFSAGLERWAGETWGAAAAIDEATPARRSLPSAEPYVGESGAAPAVTLSASPIGNWRRSMAASLAAVMIASGLLGASVAWAIAVPTRSRPAVRITVANPSFEAGATQMQIPPPSANRMEQLPQAFGIWGTDRVRLCGAEQGVAPADGRRMLAFDTALPGPGDPAVSTADSCDLYQLIDLTPYADLIAQGDCMLRLTAKVRDASGPHDVQSLFVGRLSVYDKPLAEILPAWPESRLLAASEAAERLLSSGEANRWQQVSATVSLPAGSRFAIVQIDATTMDRTPGRGAATFDRHYCDDVRVTLLLSDPVP